MRKGILNYLIIAVFAISAAFTSCEKNNNDDDNGNGDSTETSDNSGIVSRVIIEGKTNDYVYDAQNRLTSIITEGQSTFFTYSSANTINVSVGLDDFNYEVILNSDGYVTNVNVPIENYAEVYEYENGYLKKWTIKGGSNERITNFTWENGNLVSMDSDGDITHFSYSNSTCKEANVMPYIIPHIWDMYMPHPAWFGKKSKNLLSESEGSELRYGTNAKGYVSKVYWDDELFIEIQYK
jgi:hypothetical protein